MHEAVSVLNAAASVVRAGMRADTIGGIAYGAHKIDHNILDLYFLKGHLCHTEAKKRLLVHLAHLA